MTDEPEADARALYIAAGSALVLGPIGALLAAMGSDPSFWADGLRWALCMVAVAFAGALLGLVFGVPRARSDFSPDKSERYLSNSNLEQVSDWLTKLLLGAGLVELTKMPGALADAARFFGATYQSPHGEVMAATAILYGAGLGFGFGYLWTRLNLRVLLETSDKEAARASHIAQALIAATATGRFGDPESEEVVQSAVSQALTTADNADPAQRSAILWVDDYPENNSAIARSFTSLGIIVDLAMSTQEALAKLRERTYGLVISDLGRHEDDGEHQMAGLELITAMREQGSGVPVIIFAGARGKQHEAELLHAGAVMVTNRASELFPAAVRYATRG